MATSPQLQPSPVPGSVGWVGLGDKTFEFAYSPIEFIKKRTREHRSPVFKVRVLNKPTIFLTSNNAVKELLQDQNQSFEMGYKDFGYMHSLFGDLVLFFNDDDTVTRLRGLMHSMFIPQLMEQFIDTVHRTCDARLPGFVQDEPVAIYEQFKKLTTEMCLSLFLGMDFKSSDEELAKTIAGLTVTHWHGLISVPINLKIGSYSSGYSLAIDAKHRLLEFIKQHLPKSKNCLLDTMKDVGFHSIDELSEHMLLFVSALVPKALSSLLMSCCLELSKPHNASRRLRALNDDEYLDKVLLEVKRLWPPFLGGRRIAKKNLILGGFQIPKGYSVAYFTRNANLDPSVFENPEKFLPERWEGSDAPERSRVFTFGYGPRNCIGEHFIGRIIHVVIKRLLNEYDWSLESDQDLTYKWLPVSRPKYDVKAQFRKRTPEANG